MKNRNKAVKIYLESKCFKDIYTYDLFQKYLNVLESNQRWFSSQYLGDEDLGSLLVCNLRDRIYFVCEINLLIILLTTTT